MLRWQHHTLDVAGDGGGKCLEPHGLVMDRAKPFIKGDVGKTRQHLFQRGFHIFLPEEFRIGETGAQHALVAGKDHGVAFGIGEPVADNHEARLQCAIRILGHQIFLVRADRGLKHLVGKRHEAILDRPEQRRRPFDKAADLVNQPFIRTQRRPRCFGKLGRTLEKHGTALVSVDHHMAGAKPFNIIIGAGKTGEVDVSRMLEIMATADSCERQCRAAKIEFPGKRSAAEKQIHPVKRAHPAEPCGAPALAFRPGKISQHGCDHIRQQIGGGGTRFSIRANRNLPFGVSSSVSCSRDSPVDFRKPAIACSGASTRGPRRSSDTSSCRSARPST